MKFFILFILPLYFCFQLPKKVKELKIDNPAVATTAKLQKDSQQETILLTTFKLLGNDKLIQIQFLDKEFQQLILKEFNSDSKWPNLANYFPQYNLILECSGFFPNPFKATGEINLYQVLENGQISSKIKASQDKNGFFYHQGYIFDINNDGLPDIIAARVKKPLNPFSDIQAELLWLENKGNFTFEEHILIEQGPDVNFIFEDIDNDGKMEIVASQFFTEKGLFIYYCDENNWSQCNKSNIKRKVLDNQIGKGFNLQFEKLQNNNNKQILATTNEADGSGKVYIYVIDPKFKSLNTKFFEKYQIGSGYTPSLAFLPGRGAPGTALAFNLQGFTEKFIVVSGDDSGEVRLLIPKGQFQYEEVTLIQTKGTIGQISIGDFNQDGILDLFIPFYSQNKAEIWSFL